MPLTPSWLKARHCSRSLRRHGAGDHPRCEVEGFEVATERLEVETGKGADALDRWPELAAALAEAKRRRCPVLVAKLDRLSRDVAFIAGLMAQRVPFIVAELGPVLTRSCFTVVRS